MSVLGKSGEHPKYNNGLKKGTDFLPWPSSVLFTHPLLYFLTITFREISNGLNYPPIDHCLKLSSLLVNIYIIGL